MGISVDAADGLAHYGLYQSPCSDHCDELRQREEELVAMRLRGLALRRAYLKAGFENGNNEEACENIWFFCWYFIECYTACLLQPLH